MLLLAASQALKLQESYKSDDMDDLLEGVITNTHKPLQKSSAKGPVDSLVEEAVQQAKAQYKTDSFEQKKRRVIQANPLSQEEQWAQLMKEPDPLADTDIYATEKKPEEPVLVSQGDPDETEMEDDLNDLLAKSFTHEKKKQNFVSNIPVILQKKKE